MIRYCAVVMAFTNCIEALHESVKSAVIVGAGPAGLTTALMLQKRGWCTTVIEKLPAVVATTTKSYQYLIDGRSRRVLDELDLIPHLEKISVPNSQFMNITIVPPAGLGSKTIVKIPTFAGNNGNGGNNIEKYWVPRASFLDLLLTAVQNANERETDTSKHIKVMFNTSCTRIYHSPLEEQCMLRVSLSGSTKEPTSSTSADQSQLDWLDAQLVVGSDGINSVVRSSLQSMYANESLPSGEEWFGLTKLPSDAAGLRFRMLSLRPGALEGLGFPPEKAVVFSSNVGKTQQTRLRIGVLPFKSRTLSRTANMILVPDHELWGIVDADSLQRHLTKHFPQLHPLDDYFSKEELERFVRSEPGQFPQPQYARHLTYHTSGLSPGTAARSLVLGEADEAGAVLLGDAAHSFPPDLGQGINSALEDVSALCASLDRHSHLELAKALYEYDSVRSVDAKALCEIMTFAAPYQYTQAPLRKYLWGVGFLLRLLAHRLLPRLINKPAFLLVGDHTLPYSKVLAMAHNTTFRLKATAAGLALASILVLRTNIAKAFTIAASFIRNCFSC